MDEDERQRRFRETDEANTARRAAILGAHYRDMRDEEDTLPLANGVMDVADMYKFRMVPLAAGDYENATIYGITLSTPESHLKEINDAAAENAENVKYDLISDSAFRALMKRYDPPKEIHYGNIDIAEDAKTPEQEDEHFAASGDDSAENSAENSDATIDDAAREAAHNDTIARVSAALSQVRSDDMLNYLVFQADRLGASDIHLENQREDVRIRFRIDGTLHEIARLSHDKYRELFFAIASVANLSTASQEAQSGHIVREITVADAKKFGETLGEANSATGDFIENGDTYDTHTLNMRIETVPTSYGQDAVIRLFNFRSEMLQMDVLGLDDDERAELEEIISHPRGMVLVVGPTGSGKSTTLYSILNALNDPTRKILTLEDPVEFDIPGVTQIPVDTTHGQTFADNVRTILRLDPDVVMVGEIRDEDTARTAIQASITGHLLLATFHAQDAAAAFARMIDMIGINPVFATAIRLVIGQRLVRKLDDATKIEYEPDDSERKYIRGILKDVSDKVIARELGEDFDLDNFKLWKPGTSDADPFGYHGRTVLMEQLVVNDKIAGFLRGDATDVSAGEIEKAARAEGMVTMLQKGIFKVLRGETTLDEINRVL